MCRQDSTQKDADLSGIWIYRPNVWVA